MQKYSVQYLKKIYRSETDAKVKQRLQIIIYLKAKKNMREIAQLLYLSLGIVHYWKKRFEMNGLKGLEDKKGRGRKSNLNKKDKRIILNEIDKGIKMNDGYRRGYKTKDVQEMIKKLFGIIYTARHIRRLMHNERYALKVPRPRNKSRNQENVDEFKQDFKKNFHVWTKIQ
jgi:transposase